MADLPQLPQSGPVPPTPAPFASRHERLTRFVAPWLWLGGTVACVGLGLITASVRAPALLLAGIGCWLAGWVFIALGIRREKPKLRVASEAVGAKLYPRLSNYRDFYWGTLAAYGGGFFIAEWVLIVAHTLLAGSGSGKAQAAVGLSLAPPIAFAISLCLAASIAFVAGFFGSVRARRLAIPEATVGAIYFGLPIPAFLTLLSQSSGMQLKFGAQLREVFYVASLLGRPEIGIWLVYAGLCLALGLGVTFGFVATGSGRFDLKTGFELFIARRHVAVFQPRIILVAAFILITFVVPALVIIFMVKAADKAVERTRERRLGEVDPLLATAAKNERAASELSPSEFMTLISIIGVGTGVMSLIIVLSVMSGFEADLQQKILGTNAHAVVLKYSDSFEDYGEAMEKIATIPGITGQTPFIMNEVMISSEGNISGTVIKGIDPETVGQVSDLPRNIQPGGKLEYLVQPEKILEKRKLHEPFDPEENSSPDLENDPIIGKPKPKPEGSKEAILPGIVVGRELASSLKVVVGDRVNVVSPLGGDMGPQGPMPKMRPFRVAAIFHSGMYEYDSKFVYIRIDEARKFFNVKGATGIELKVADIDDARKIARQAYDKLEGYPFHTKDWGEMNRNLFSALRLEKLVMGIILSIIVIVAAGLIVATVVMLVLEKRKEISVLKALGVPDGGIVKIFLAEGLQIGFAGGLLGLVTGLGWCLLIEKVGIKLDPEVYYIPALPVRIEPVQTALAVVVAILVTYLGSIYPAIEASQVEPVEGLKAE
ncbi:MAG: FtsX-like permease family protein [Myxococcaceae bacterium]